MPAPEDFYTSYVANSRPVVLRNVMSDIPALKKWEKDSYLKEKYACTNLQRFPVCVASDAYANDKNCA